MHIIHVKALILNVLECIKLYIIYASSWMRSRALRFVLCRSSSIHLSVSIIYASSNDDAIGSPSSATSFWLVGCGWLIWDRGGPGDTFSITFSVKVHLFSRISAIVAHDDSVSVYEHLVSIT